MRHKLFATVTAAILILGAGTPDLVAQSTGDKYFGAQAGASLSSFINNNYWVTDNRWGFTGGLFGGMQLNQNLALNVEANWVQKGVKADGTEDTGIRLDYIQVPVTLAGGASGFNAYIGIGIGFKVGCSAPSAVFWDCDEVNSTEWTLPMGLNYKWKLDGGKFIGFDVRYDLGLSDVFENGDVRNRAWLFRVQFGAIKGR